MGWEPTNYLTKESQRSGLVNKCINEWLRELVRKGENE